MKTVCSFICSIILFQSVSTAQIGGYGFDVPMGMGLNQLGKTVPFHGGLGMSLFFNFPASPLSIGYRLSGNFYGNTKREQMPFIMEDYVHTVANITNNHSINQNTFFMRYSMFNTAVVSPFIEIGAGYAVYKSTWSAQDPFEADNDNCEGYMMTETILKDGTFFGQGSAGINIKFNQLMGKCSGFWLTLAMDYMRGGYVQHLNSEINPSQFFYEASDMNAASRTTNSNPRSADMDHQSGTCSTGDNYYYTTVFNARHEMVQFRVGFNWVFGDCRK